MLPSRKGALTRRSSRLGLLLGLLVYMGSEALLDSSNDIGGWFTGQLVRSGAFGGIIATAILVVSDTWFRSI